MIRNTLILPALLAATVAYAPATAGAPHARLVGCGAESCLLLSGHRASPDAAVAVNGHAVAVEGQRRWRARLPVRTVRALAEPYARSVSVTVDGREIRTALPTGMLGHSEELAMLVVRAK